jgi:hypothetical protein
MYASSKLIFLVAVKELEFVPLFVRLILHGLVCTTVLSFLTAGFYYYGSVPQLQVI